MTMATRLNCPLRIVSYNARGFRSSQSYVNELLNDCDILCLQEHWLLDQHIHNMNIRDDFIVMGVSGMDPERYLLGRPYGGCAIFYRQDLSSKISMCQVSSRRFCAIRLKISDSETLLLICVYLPYDTGLSSGNQEYLETLSELEGFLDSQDYDALAIVGDFNTDFRRDGRQRVNDLKHFMTVNNLIAKDLDFADIQFTYESDDGLRRSWLDHVLVSSNLLNRICEINVVCDGANLSDHRPVCVWVDWAHPSSLPASVSCSHAPTRHLAWYKATNKQIDMYKSLVTESCRDIEIPEDVVNCVDPNCSVHSSILERLCSRLVSCLTDSAEQSIPKCGGRRLAGWNEEVRPLKDQSILWNRIWREAGCPSAGVLAQLRKHAKSRYKYAARRLIRNQDQLRRKSMAEALLRDSSRDFWQEVGQCKRSKQSPASYVDGVHGDVNIANLWVSRFKDLFSSSDPHAHDQLADMIAELKITSSDLDVVKVSPDIVYNSIKKLKKGKSDGGNLMSDHLISAPCSFIDILAPVFTSLIRHGYMPPCFSDALIQPIPKGNNKDYSLSANYRGIALSSCFSKVIELCILEVYGDHLLTSQLQFGFKSGLSTTMCTGVLKAVVSRYMNGGSKVYGCLIDASKAFDTVDHSILLGKLLSRGLPMPAIRFLLRWYQTQRLRTKWNGCISDAFSVSRGVRQGGVLSPILFTLYIDDLLHELSTSKVGCYWDNIFVGALAYADDLTLLAPTPSALRKLLCICEKTGSHLKLKFNPDKTQCIKFSRESPRDCHLVFQFCGKYIECVKCITHLGHDISQDLVCDVDIHRCQRDFIRRANGVLLRFGFCSPKVLTRLLRSYCMSFYGCALWELNSKSIKCLEVCMNKVLRRIWSLPYCCHTDILHSVSGCYSILNVCYNRFCKLVQSAKSSCNYLVRCIFHDASNSCRNFIGYNIKYGSVFVRDYSCVNHSLVELVKEIRDTSLYVSDFDKTMLNEIACTVSCL